MKRVSVVIGAEIEVMVSDEVAATLKNAGLAGERDASKFIEHSTELARVVNELKAHGADCVWVKKVTPLYKE